MAGPFEWWVVMPSKPGYSFVRWFAWNEVVIAAGFIFPSWLLVNAIVSGWDPIWQFLILIIGGVVQGFLTGFVQWALFARAGITPPLLPWLAFTTAGTALAWIVVQVPGFLPVETDAPARVPLVAVGIAVALAVPMIAQWWVLKSITASAWKFAAIAYLGWLIGAGIMGSTLLILAGVTDLKVTIALLIVGAFAAVMCASAGTWLGAVAVSGQTKARTTKSRKMPTTRAPRTAKPASVKPARSPSPAKPATKPAPKPTKTN